MINRQRLSTVLYFISAILLLYPGLFKIPYTVNIVILSWTLLSVSRALIIFPNIKTNTQTIKIGKVFK